MDTKGLAIGLLQNDRDAAYLMIYRIQEAYGTGNLAMLEEAIQESYRLYPHMADAGAVAMMRIRADLALEAGE